MLLSLQMGIVGLPNVGKSTLFNVLAKVSIPAENFPFCTIEPNNVRLHQPLHRRVCGQLACCSLSPPALLCALMLLHVMHFVHATTTHKLDDRDEQFSTCSPILSSTCDDHNIRTLLSRPLAACTAALQQLLSFMAAQCHLSTGCALVCAFLQCMHTSSTTCRQVLHSPLAGSGHSVHPLHQPHCSSQASCSACLNPCRLVSTCQMTVSSGCAKHTRPKAKCQPSWTLWTLLDW